MDDFMDDVFEQSGPQRLVAGGVWFLVLMVMSGAFWWLWSIVLSRAYGPAGYGIFNTAYSLQNFLWVFFLGGLFQGVMKYGSEHIVRRKWILSEHFSMSLRFMTLIGVLLFLFLSFIAFRTTDTIMRIMLLSIALSFLFSGMKDALSSIIGSFQKSDYLSIINSTRPILVLIMGGMLIILGFPAELLPVLLVVGTLWELLISSYFIRSYAGEVIPFGIGALFRGRKVGRSVFMEEFRRFAEVLVFGFFISLTMIMFNFMKSLDIVILKLFYDYAGVGIYSVADTVSSILFYMTSFSLPVIPAIAEAHAKDDKNLLKKYVKIAMEYPLLIGIPLTLTIQMMAGPIVVGLYGPEFSAAVQPLQILIIGTFMLMFSYNLSSILIGLGRARLSGMLMTISAVEYITLLLIMLPHFGFLAAAFSLTITGFTSMLLVPYYLKRELDIPISAGMLKVLCAAVLMEVIMLAMNDMGAFYAILGILLGLASFIGLLYLTGYLTAEDLRMMKVAGGSFSMRRKNR